MRFSTTRRRSMCWGSTTIYAVIALIAIVGFTSFAIDLGRVQLAKTELQSAVDAAARYGASGLSSGVTTVKSRVVSAAADNTIDGRSLVIDPNVDIEFGTFNSTTRTFTVLTGTAQSTASAIRVTGRRLASRGTGVPLLCGALFGVAACDVRAVAIAGSSVQGADVFLIQDVTGSFRQELPEAKEGDQALLDSLNASGAGGRFGLAVHTGWGRTLAPITAISGNYSYLSSKISSIDVAGSSGMPIASGTDIASGFDEAIAAYTATGYVTPPSGKTVILVSDGQPTSDRDGKHPTLSDSQLLTLAQTRANTLWSNGVHVYVVFMDTANDSIAAANLRTLIRGNGDFVRVTDSAQLPAALAELSRSTGGRLLK